MVGNVTFSQPIGYLEKGHDFDGTLKNSAKVQDYFSVVGAMRFLDHWLNKNPIIHVGPPGFFTPSQAFPSSISPTGTKAMIGTTTTAINPTS